MCLHQFEQVGNRKKITITALHLWLVFLLYPSLYPDPRTCFGPTTHPTAVHGGLGPAPLHFSHRHRFYTYVIALFFFSFRLPFSVIPLPIRPDNYLVYSARAFHAVYCTILLSNHNHRFLGDIVAVHRLFHAILCLRTLRTMPPSSPMVLLTPVTKKQNAGYNRHCTISFSPLQQLTTKFRLVYSLARAHLPIAPHAGHREIARRREKIRERKKKSHCPRDTCFLREFLPTSCLALS